ncbi:hypothetical protein [Escherichia albertii]
MPGEPGGLLRQEILRMEAQMIPGKRGDEVVTVIIVSWPDTQDHRPDQ